MLQDEGKRSSLGEKAQRRARETFGVLTVLAGIALLGWAAPSGVDHFTFAGRIAIAVAGYALSPIDLIPDFIPDIPAFEMGGRRFSKEAECGYVLRRSRSTAPMIRMSVIENPQDAHSVGLQRAKQRIVSKEAIASAPFHIRPQQIHPHKSEAGRAGEVECVVVSK